MNICVTVDEFEENGGIMTEGRHVWLKITEAI